MIHRAVFVLLALAASAQAQSLPVPLPAWVAVDSAARSVHLTLDVTTGVEPGTGLLNGHRKGDIQLIIPLGWTIRWSWHNADSAQSHSLVVMAEREKLPSEGGHPAFDNAMTRMPSTGLKPGLKDETTFVADQGGWYWMLCGVPGHAIRGEWIGLRVSPDANEVSIKLRGQ